MSTVCTKCISCDDTSLRTLDNRMLQRGVASDSKPWPRTGTYVICENCGHTQKILDESWQADVAKIYGSYEMYSLAGGGEQLVFDGGQVQPRTKRLIDMLQKCVSMPSQGSILDVGCAVGSMLKTFHSIFPKWNLSGFDITSHSESLIRSLPANFYTGSLDDIHQKFDLVTMHFVVEHLPNPRKVMEQFRRLLKPDGIIWIHTSDYWANPFDLTVVDHSSHFMVDTLAELIERCGFDVIDRNDNWNIKETGVVARIADRAPIAMIDDAKKAERLAGAPKRFQWLENLVGHAHATAENGGIAILGTSIAATWLASMIEDDVVLFVDEDQQRVGKTHMAKPVVTPREVPADVPVYLAFPTFQAQKIQCRLSDKYPEMTFVVPPPLAA